MALGFAWYGPVFGSKWKELMGFTDESMKAMKVTPLQATIGGLIGALLMAYILGSAIALFVAKFPTDELVATGALFGFWSWLGFVVPVTAGVFLWEGKPLALWVLNAGYYFVSLLAMGVILALWV